VCSKCGKVGHLQKVCRSKRTGLPKATETALHTEQSGTKTKPVHTVVKEGTDEYELQNVTSPGKVRPWNVSVGIEGIAVLMQLDTGASQSLMSETKFRELWPQRNLNSSEIKPSSHSGESIPVVGSLQS